MSMMTAEEQYDMACLTSRRLSVRRLWGQGSIKVHMSDSWFSESRYWEIHCGEMIAKPCTCITTL